MDFEREYVLRCRAVTLGKASFGSALEAWTARYLAARVDADEGAAGRVVTGVRVGRCDGAPSIPEAPACDLVEAHRLFSCELFSGTNYVTDGHYHPKLH